MPKKGERKLWVDAYSEWADALLDQAARLRLNQTSVTEHLLDDLPKPLGRSRDTATFNEMAVRTRHEHASTPHVGKVTLQYLACIFRYHKAETPGNWHLTEPRPARI